MCADFRESSGVSLLAACDVEVPPRECAQKGGAARVDAQKIGPEWWTPGRPDRLQYSWISVVVLYKPRSLPLATKAACDRWQRLLATCTATAPTVLFPDNNRVAQNLTAVTACVAARMPHRGALHIYTAIPAPRTIGLARGRRRDLQQDRGGKGSGPARNSRGRATVHLQQVSGRPAARLCCLNCLEEHLSVKCELSVPDISALLQRCCLLSLLSWKP